MDDMLDINKEDCFGEESAIYADTIKEYINDERRDSRYYEILARRAPKRDAHIFRQFSMDEMAHARRFSTALYLITGRRYFPSLNELDPVIAPPYEQALRQRFRAESRDAVKYPTFAKQVTNDRCLRKLAIDTGKAEEQHAAMIFDMMHGMNV